MYTFYRLDFNLDALTTILGWRLSMGIDFGELKTGQHNINHVREIIKTLEKGHYCVRPVEKNQKYRHVLYANNDFELVLIQWGGFTRSGVHHHFGQKCWFRVLKGLAEVCDYNMEGASSVQIMSPCDFQRSAEVHEVSNVLASGTTTLHFYAKPISSFMSKGALK
jgi:hypothetical protein